MKRELLQHLHEQNLIRFKKIQSPGNYFGFLSCLGEDEFELDGKMYDVVRETKCGDTSIYYCLPDSKETEIKSIIHHWMKENFGHANKQKKENEPNWSKWLDAKYCIHHTKYHFELPFSWLSFEPSEKNLSSISISPLILPPEIY